MGASSGIGRALALELARGGAQVAVSARRSDKLQELVNELPGDGHIALQVDVANHDSLKDAFAIIREKWDDLDSVIYMAATYFTTRAERESIDNISRAIDINIMGAFRVVDIVRPYFQSRGGGQIILTGSVAGYRGLPAGQPYCATKAAINNYAESLKIELEPYNIDVRLICPGFVETDLTAKNNFEMPMMISADEAARNIVKGLKSNKFEIHFPWLFTFFMKFLDILPRSLYFKMARLMIKKSGDNL